MKIKFTQLNSQARHRISYALEKYAASLFPQEDEEKNTLVNISLKIRHGELLIGEYQYNDLEKGGKDEAGY